MFISGYNNNFTSVSHCIRNIFENLCNTFLVLTFCLLPRTLRGRTCFLMSIVTKS